MQDRDTAVMEEKLDQADTLPAPYIYEVVRRDGEEELLRPFGALFFSGLAAGVLISASVLGQAVFARYLPAAEWTELLVALGYPLGFLLVMLGRMQLFTENTITTVLPLMANPSGIGAMKVARLWAVVLGANVVGAIVAAAAFHSGIVPADFSALLVEISKHAVTGDPLSNFLRGIPAGLIIAAIVWMLAHGRGSAVMVITVFVWFIAVADFTHVVAGSVEAAYLVIGGEMALTAAAFSFFFPTLFGNILGGTLIFSLLAWAQVHREIEDHSISKRNGRQALAPTND